MLSPQPGTAGDISRVMICFTALKLASEKKLQRDRQGKVVFGNNHTICGRSLFRGGLMPGRAAEARHVA